MELCAGDQSRERLGQEIASTWARLNNSYDATLVTDDKITFYVHRSILSSCSQYFRALFKLSPNRNSYKLFDVPHPIFSLIYKFACGGSISVDMDNVTDILCWSDYLSVLEVVTLCIEFVVERFTPDNCIGIRNFARSFCVSSLEMEAQRFILNHFVEVSQNEEYLQLPLEELVEILSSDSLNVVDETCVWEAALSWMQHDLDQRRRYLPTLLKCVRRGLLDMQYFHDNVEANSYVVSDSECRFLVDETLSFLSELRNIGLRQEAVVTPPLATPRLPHDVLFAFGGWTGGAASSLLETYDTKADRWRIIEMRAERPRAYHKLAVIGFDIYVIGGFDGSEYFNSCRCFNAFLREWRSAAPMNCKRCYISVATLNDLLYAIGGYDGHHRQNTVERYDPQQNQWTFISNMHMQRSDASAAAVGNRIYVVGGFNGLECMSSCEFFDVNLEQWTMVAAPMAQRRSGVSAVAFHGSLYVLGGFNGITRLSSAERLDTETLEWTSVPEMFYPRSNFAVEVLDDMIFVLGGFNGVGTINHVECYNERTSEWFEATSMSSTRSALAACVIRALPDVSGYAHPDRSSLMEEKRQKIIQMQQLLLQQERAAQNAANDEEIDLDE